MQAALSKDLAKFMKGLDFSTVRLDEVEDEAKAKESTEEEEESEGEGEGGESSSEATSDAPEQKTEKKEEKPNITIPKVGPNSKLVCLSFATQFALLTIIEVT